MQKKKFQKHSDREQGIVKITKDDSILMEIKAKKHSEEG